MFKFQSSYCKILGACFWFLFLHLMHFFEQMSEALLKRHEFFGILLGKSSIEKYKQHYWPYISFKNIVTVKNTFHPYFNQIATLWSRKKSFLTILIFGMYSKTSKQYLAAASIWFKNSVFFCRNRKQSFKRRFLKIVVSSKRDCIISSKNTCEGVQI